MIFAFLSECLAIWFARRFSPLRFCSFIDDSSFDTGVVAGFCYL